MKKTNLLSLILVASLIFVSCKEKTKKDESEKTNTEKGFLVDTETSTIGWIAYKTTDKVPVKGVFSAFSIENPTKGISPKEALNNLKFKIPINSLQTKDTLRDEKLKKFFFGTMENTTHITGTLHMTNDASGKAEITMNGVSHSLPITYAISDQMVKIEAVMNLDNWKAQAAIRAINLACIDLHKGADGVSKTWSEVKIEIVTNLKYE